MQIVKSIMTNNPCYKSGRKIAVKGLMLHSVGCSQPSAQVFINSWNSASFSSACVHAFIDGNNGNVYQTLPWNYRGWHGGRGSNGSCNDTHIGIEMCEPSNINYTSGGRFTCSNTATARECVKRTYQSAVELFAYLCNEYGLNPLTDIISHKEGWERGIATNHGDPEHLWNGLNMGYSMNGFRRDVLNFMNGNGGLTMTQYEELKQENEELKRRLHELENPMIYNYVDKNMPEFARPTIQKLMDKGILKGEGSGLNLNYEMLRILVINDRAGIYD